MEYTLSKIKSYITAPTNSNDDNDSNCNTVMHPSDLLDAANQALDQCSSAGSSVDSRSEEYESSIVHPKLNLSMMTDSTSSSSSSDDAVPFSDPTGWTPPEGFGACFSAYACKCREYHKKNNDPLLPFRNFCYSENFAAHVKQCGVGFSKFTPNPHLVEGHAMHDQFRSLMTTTKPAGLLSKSSSGDIPDSACLSIVFHGTRQDNVDAILQGGLDPRKRTGQAYGPGEYFSKDPTVSVSYCKGGLSMLVFLVVVPPKEQQHTSLPQDYVVVKENAHQLPLGVLHFDTVDKDALNRAYAMKGRLKRLSEEMLRKQTNMMEAQTKAYIIQLLIQEKTDLAIEKYDKHRGVLKKESLREISMYVHERFDADLATCLFADLPEPYDVKEFESRQDSKTVEAHEQEAQKAKSKLEEARKGTSAAQNYFSS